MTAIPIPGGRRQFFNASGQPLSGGTVTYYGVGGLTPAVTWQDIGQTIQNIGPITLDALGSAKIWGVGQYREIVKDSQGAQQWDENTEALVNLNANVILTVTGGPPGANQWLGGEAITQTIVFGANFVGAHGKIPKTLPAASFQVLIKQNNTQIGTATCSTGGAWVFLSTSGLSYTLNPGDEVDFLAPGVADAAIADWGLTLPGSYVPS